MANPKHLKILRKGVERWNKWREENSKIYPNLSQANLGGANLRRANLSSANLSGANLNRANLSNANLKWAELIETSFILADLSNANLSNANLSQTDLRRANLSGASFDLTNLRHAKLGGADLRWTKLRAYLEESDFANCYISDTTFANVDLSRTKGLDEIQHLGPSTIGIDTIQRSQGNIPDIFLRGAGVSDEMIAFIRAMGGAIQFYSCFISYSGKDQLFAERLYEALQARGVRCWFAPHDVQGGKKLHEQIDVAIRVHERLLLILSPDSINSEWVKTEIAKARKREVTEKRQMLFPVMLKISYEELKRWELFDADIGKDSAREIREYFIPDFTKWESAAKFKEEFEKLIRDLTKADEAKKAAEA